MKLLAVGADAKTVKGEKKGYLTGILYLAPATESGVMNTCTSSSPGCRAACLFTAGRAAQFPAINQSRIRKTQWLASDRGSFLAQLEKDIVSTIKKAKRESMTPCFRLNGTSDLPWLGHYFAAKFPRVQFYDYTKHPRPWNRLRKNYHLTFSLSEHNLKDAMQALENGINVAVVFDVKKGQPLPKTWNGFKVHDGDVNDLRFMMKNRRKPVIEGLRAKGRAKKDCSGFVQKAQLVQIGAVYGT
jgi:hypothetical protein